MMLGVAIEEIREAIVDAYSPEDLSETLRILMNVRLYVIVPPGAFGHQVFELLQWAELRGRDVELVRAVARARPRKAKLQEIYKKYGMAIPVYVEKAGTQVSGAPTDEVDSGLEKIIKPHLAFSEFGIWRERMAQVEGRVCLITNSANARGTGFLVGPDVVLTNYHVMEPLLKGTSKVADFECVFDFKRLPDGTTASTPARLHPTDWNIDSSPYAPSEGSGQPAKTEPTSDQLDYSLVRLAEDVGSKAWAINSSPNSGAPVRGWVRIPDVAPAFKSPMGVLIAQHPAGWPLKLAIDTEAINQAGKHWLNGNGTRVRYATNTLSGSSGSPVFDLEWNVIALHHYGDPAYNHPARFNQGIPIGQIRDRLRRVGKEAALGGDLS